MCELFAMSSLEPTNVRFSLEEFARHGGLEGPHKDGWGIAYYEGRDARLVKEAYPAFDSACVRFIQEHPFDSSLVLSHIRRATRGVATMANCQPFARELGGRVHLFAHNGDLDLARLRAEMPLATFQPVGETDSEYAFCALLDRLRALWLDGIPALEARFTVVRQFAARLRALGPANFLYADADALFIHGHQRIHTGGALPRPPGLQVLCRRCTGRRDGLALDGVSLTSRTEQTVVLAASVPLTGEAGWRALAEGELLVARRGLLLAPERVAASLD